MNAICGKVNPSGKLNEIWPITLQDTPNYTYYPGYKKTSEYREGPYIGYRYYETAHIDVRFPFGFGMSYTQFSYNDIQVDKENIQFVIKNTGSVAGAEIAQVYIGLKNSAVFRPIRELKGFSKVFLEPGESKSITIPLDDKAFRYYNSATGKFEREPGNYLIEVGASVEDIRLEATVQIEGTVAPIPYNPTLLPSYYTGQINNVSAQEFTELLGRPIPESTWNRSAPLEYNDTFSQLFYAKGWVGRSVYKVLTHLKNKAEKKGDPDLNILFIYNLPFRGVAKMMMGAVDMNMVDGLLLIFNGHFFKGTGHLTSSWFKKVHAEKTLRRKLTEIPSQPQNKEVLFHEEN